MSPCFIGISFATLTMASETGRCIIALEKGVAQIPFRNDEERDSFLSQLADSFPERLRQSYLVWKQNRMVKEREDANKPVPKPADAPDRLQQHKAEFAAEQEARKKVS